jgi:hypothetical protein
LSERKELGCESDHGGLLGKRDEAGGWARR